MMRFQTARRLSLAIVLSSTLAAPYAAAQLSPSTAAAQVTEFDVNGLKVLIKRRPGSQTMAGGLFVRGGATSLTPKTAGIESLMLDVATEASTKYPLERLRRELARTGTSLSAQSTEDYSVIALAATAPNFERAWDMFVDVALHPTLATADVERVRAQTLASLRGAGDGAESRLQQFQDSIAYIGHPYANLVDGTEQTVSSFTAADLRAYHRQVMQTSRLLLVLVGDLDPVQMRQRIAAAFGTLPRGTYVAPQVPTLSFTSAALTTDARDLPTNYVQGIFSAPGIAEGDIYPLRVATSILRDRVFNEVRVKRNLSYAPDAFLRSRAANVGGLYVTAVDANQAVSVMLAEVKRLQTEPVDQDAIDATATSYLTQYYTDQETNAAQAGTLAQYELIGGGWRNSFETITRSLAVRPADIQRVAQRYMKNWQFVVVGDPSKIDRAIFIGR